MARKAQEHPGGGTHAAGRPARRKSTPRKTASAPAPHEGRRVVRPDIAEYRAAAEAQAEIVRERINAALEVSRRTREDIEQRIADQLHTPHVARKAAAPARKRTRASPRPPAK